jgi:large subunit ribosomal protein L20
MSRAKSGVVNKKRHKKILKLAKGYRGRGSTCFRVAVEKVEKALRYAYRDRKARKRDFRALWIQRINAAVRAHGISYSVFIDKLNKANIEINRKMLSEMAARNIDDFNNLVKQVIAA